MQGEWLERSCPNCGCNRVSKTPISRAHTQAETLTFQQVKDYFVGLRRDQVFFSYYRCIDCGLLYAPRYFSAEQLDELYSEMPDNLMGEDKETISKTQTGYVKWLSSRIDKVGSYLELGPDIGLVAGEIARKFEIDSAIMIEPNLAVHSELEKSLKFAKKVSTYRQLEDVHERLEVDLVGGIHVYDHLLEPVSDLKRIDAFTGSTSHLLIVVHDELSILRRLMRSKWPPFCLQHPQLFNERTLSDILLTSGWKMESVSKSVNWWHLNHFARIGSEVLGVPSGWTRVLPGLQFPVKLGNMIALASKLGN